MMYYFWITTKDVFCPIKKPHWELCPILLNENGQSIDGDYPIKDWWLRDKQKINLGVEK